MCPKRGGGGGRFHFRPSPERETTRREEDNKIVPYLIQRGPTSKVHDVVLHIQRATTLHPDPSFLQSSTGATREFVSIIAITWLGPVPTGYSFFEGPN
ncbi:unnamed protein product [Linum trigynum]|uniref:Uncharacterized protein n=1 Tax=Linum trigynum TaxID=586398 RepID=A0AAV2C716_9ROSI